ncbi:MAG: hypothetical protein M0036_10355 [Desulfobacteraceae bacterium]|nr:hypothetical protein [Desulfobacteraceae bacterium]
MEIVALMASGWGYRGCLFDAGEYLFFQYSFKGRFRPLKRYPAGVFSDHEQFTAMMMKYMIPSAFCRPPLPIAGLNLPELERIYRIIQKNATAT